MKGERFKIGVEGRFLNIYHLNSGDVLSYRNLFYLLPPPFSTAFTKKTIDNDIMFKYISNNLIKPLVSYDRHCGNR